MTRDRGSHGINLPPNGDSPAAQSIAVTQSETANGFAGGESAVILGLVNALIRPILTVLTLPITILTLGLFYLLVNGFTFLLASKVVPGF